VGGGGAAPPPLDPIPKHKTLIVISRLHPKKLWQNVAMT